MARYLVAMTGASGAAYGVDFVKRCPGDKFLVLSDCAAVRPAPRARARGRRLNGFAIVVDGAVPSSTSRSVPPGLRRFIAATAGS